MKKLTLAALAMISAAAPAVAQTQTWYLSQQPPIPSSFPTVQYDAAKAALAAQQYKLNELQMQLMQQQLQRQQR